MSTATQCVVREFDEHVERGKSEGLWCEHFSLLFKSLLFCIVFYLCCDVGLPSVSNYFIFILDLISTYLIMFNNVPCTVICSVDDTLCMQCLHES